VDVKCCKMFYFTCNHGLTHFRGELSLQTITLTTLNSNHCRWFRPTTVKSRTLVTKHISVDMINGQHQCYATLFAIKHNFASRSVSFSEMTCVRFRTTIIDFVTRFRSSD